MERERRADPRLGRLPSGAMDIFTSPLARFLRIETAGGAVLLLAAVVALAVSNSA